MGNSEKKSADANVGVSVAGGGFPRVMMVRDLPDRKWLKRVVVCANKTGCVAYNIIEELDDLHDGTEFIKWRFYKEVEPETKFMELTIDEIAERFGVSASQISIKK